MIKTLYPLFRRWSENGSVYILSDPHFADPDCRLMDPWWIVPEEQVEIINRAVKKNDTFVCLGDVGSPEYAAAIRTPRKVLILGNHDRKKDYEGIFPEIYDGPLFIAKKILLSHEPVMGLPWCLNIHGHDHNGTGDYGDGCRHINLAANVCGYVPVSLSEIIKNGALSGIRSIHRITIDRAEAKKAGRTGRDGEKDAKVAEAFCTLSDGAYDTYSQWAEELCSAHAKESDVESLLSGLLDFVHDERCRQLYRMVCGKYIYDYPDTVGAYMDKYKESLCGA